jgi:hypothetical protein
MDDRGREGSLDQHRREQRRAWLRLTYRERLRWLEEAKGFAAKALEAARARRSRTPRGTSESQQP